MNSHALIDTGLGRLTVVCDSGALRGVYFPGHWVRPKPAHLGPRVRSSPLAEQFAGQLEGYLAGARRDFDLPVALEGSPFERAVWHRLTHIPYGTTITYGELGRQIGAGDPREIGAAVGRNPLSIVVPCHRVVGKDGRLTGYAGGLARKRRLLELEAGALVLPGLSP